MEIFQPLTGLRFIAAIMVFLYHYSPDYNLSNLQSSLFQQFYLGVNMFFVLSGFLITYHYYPISKTQKFHYIPFLLKRLARIIPLYILVLTINYFALYLQNSDHQYLDLKPVLINLFLLNGYSETYIFSGLHPSWSLTAECTFYILTPLIFGIHKKYSSILIIWSIFLIICLLLISLNSYFIDYTFIGSTDFIFFDTFFGRSLEFLLGMKAALHLKKMRTNNRSISHHNYLVSGGLIMLFAISLLTVLYDNKIVSRPNEITSLIIGNLIFPIGTALLLIGLCAGTSIISNFLAQPFIQILGKSSYAFYLIHVGPIAQFINKNISSNHLLVPVLLFAISYLLYSYFETPARIKTLSTFNLNSHE